MYYSVNSLSLRMDLKPIFRMHWSSDPLASQIQVPDRHMFIQCGPQFNPLGPSPSSATASRHRYGVGHVGRSRLEWQSSCAILAGKIMSQEQNAEKIIAGGDGQPTLDIVPVKDQADNPSPRLPRSLSVTDVSPAPMHGSKLRVAYQGVPGSYSEAAAEKAYPSCEAIPCDQFEIAFQAVELRIADRAVLPVENSLFGSISRNYDLLLRHRLHIVGEVQLPVHHCLLANVISHPQALSQCELTITRLGLDVVREAVDDTTGAMEYVAANGLRDTAAEMYEIQDDPNNVTRFVMLAREPVIPRTDRPFKTSVVFAQEKGTRVLFKVLSAFAFRNINLTKIESRPHRYCPIRLIDDGNHFEYMFYVDFEASLAEVRTQNALANVQEFTSFMRVLGSYPMDTVSNRSIQIKH